MQGKNKEINSQRLLNEIKNVTFVLQINIIGENTAH